jgi:extradiol dioxygenase family protein
VASSAANKVDPSNAVDGHDVPIPHFGVVLEMDTWKALRDRLIANELQFIIEPHIRFAGKVGEQATMFFHDPSGNAVEFKAFADIETELFKA